MKLISFVIPCYNSEAYMDKAINSALELKEKVEVIIVNDGSKDGTLKKALEYKEKYPKIVKVIDKENGGHGSAVNAGLKKASGKYFKIIDSDDYIDKTSLFKVTEVLENTNIDMMVVNYVYEKENGTREVKYQDVMEEGKIISWDDVGKFSLGKYLLMHSVIYRTSLLKEINLELPEHTFYVDNIFVYYPLVYVKTMYYLNVPFYRYFIGREDQSVNEKIMISRIDQQIRVTKLMIDFFDPFLIENKNLREYLIHYLDIMMSVSTIFLKLANTKQDKEKLKDLWDYLDSHNKELRKHFLVAKFTRLPRILAIPGYRVAQMIFKFN